MSGLTKKIVSTLTSRFIFLESLEIVEYKRLKSLRIEAGSKHLSLRVSTVLNWMKPTYFHISSKDFNSKDGFLGFGLRIFHSWKKPCLILKKALHYTLYSLWMDF